MTACYHVQWHLVVEAHQPIGPDISMSGACATCQHLVLYILQTLVVILRSAGCRMYVHDMSRL